MATVEMIWGGLQNQISTALSGTNPLLPNITTAVYPAAIWETDWPPLKSLQSVSTGQLPTIISAFDRGAEKNITQAITLFYALPPTTGTAGASITPSSTFLGPSQSITLTGSGIPLKNDAFFLTLITGSAGQTQVMAEYIVPNSTTSLSSALTAFNTQINTLAHITSSLVSDVITVTNHGVAAYQINTGVVNIGTFTQEGYRWDREIQITVWSRTPADRQKYGTILEQLFTQLEVNFGFEADDQSWCRVMVVDDLVHKDSQLQDIYRRDWILRINYPVLNTINAYAIEKIPQEYENPVPD